MALLVVVAVLAIVVLSISSSSSSAVVVVVWPMLAVIGLKLEHLPGKAQVCTHVNIGDKFQGENVEIFKNWQLRGNLNLCLFCKYSWESLIEY